ncbi:MAG: CHASE3 domain-containing protein, partial [Gammaproteobacteria bacterium]
EVHTGQPRTFVAALPPQDQLNLLDRLRLLPGSLLVTLFGVMVASSVALVLSELSYRRTLGNAARVTQILNRLDASADFRVLMVDAETGQRGFLLTHDISYLAPFESATARFDASFNRLRTLSPGPANGKALDRLRDTAIERLSLTERSVNRARDSSFDQAVDVLREGSGKELMNQFRQQVSAFEASAATELSAVRAAQGKDTFWLRLATVVFTLLVFGLLIAVTRLFLDEAVRQRAYAKEKEDEADRMQRLVMARTTELFDLSAHLQTVSEREKADLARNLHDELGGLLTAARMDLSWLQGATKGMDAQIAAKLGQLNMAFTQAMDVKRRVVESLRPALLDHFGLPTALQNHFDDTCKKAGLNCKTTIPEEIAELPQDLAIALFRVGQESLTNIIRHAKAKNVDMTFEILDDVIHVRVRDDGVGMELDKPQMSHSHGISGMRHRIQSLGGTFQMVSAVGRGTSLTIAVPRNRSPAPVPFAEHAP